MNQKKTIMITGGTRGLGQATAIHLLKNKYNVAFNYKKNNQGTKELEASFPENLLTCQGSITDDQSNKEFIKKTIEKFGKIDVLINNAGLSLYGLLTDNNNEDLKNLIETNIQGTLSITRKVIPELIKTKGLIINISSIWGCKGASCETAYAMTKGAINQLTTSLAKELGPAGVRSITVAPGLIETQMNENLELEDFIQEIPLKRMGKAEDIAKLIAFLIETTYINGANIIIDGGYSI